MNEQLLQFIWKHRLFQPGGVLRTRQGEPIRIEKPGRINTDAGPDFTEAHIRFDDVLLVGNVELHVRTSDWQRHGHQHDKRYDNIILHVVYEHDTETAHERHPVLELKPLLPAKVLQRYGLMMQHPHQVPCGPLLKGVDGFILSTWKHRLVVERLQRKSEWIQELLQLTQGNWQETFYMVLCHYWGMKVNAVPFELLARSLPQQVLGRHRGRLIEVEALLLGQAGLLGSTTPDAYEAELQQHYQHLRRKYQLQPMEPHQWKYLRMRPNNFPPVRMALLAALVHQSNSLLAAVTDAHSLEELTDWFSVEASPYWNQHYRLGVTASRTMPKRLGKEAVKVLLINAVIPTLFVYARHIGDDALGYKALEWLEEIEAEDNTIIRSWTALGLKNQNACDSQALIQLKESYCNVKKCLSCAIGHHLLKY
jgi:hypothetical protein